MNKFDSKKSVLITPDVIEECLSESFGVREKTSPSHRKDKKHLN
ncbi:hypothetical protein ACSVC9_07990 [Clostridium sp. LBM24168]